MADEKPKIHSTDKALLDAAAGKAPEDELVELTPDLMGYIRQSLDSRFAYINETYPKLVDECPYETKLAVAAWVFKALVDHAREGGTFRYLIYDRLGFGPDAYVPLYEAGGMTISNEFNLGEGHDNKGRSEGENPTGGEGESGQAPGAGKTD